jgi:hypothetical protein
LQTRGTITSEKVDKLGGEKESGRGAGETAIDRARRGKADVDKVDERK